ncbi:hypothetical protein ParKJ_03765 [Paraburkholderia fungorum]|jgi:hypothetical protein|uniref:Uncharacterized protein n=1 Tax=Paraburkholderia fungorum TaxID=134537 RepID=A0AAP5Q2W5_9BURK|nr:hypothetical protein [Paraburkholderia fungorum]MDT8836521.1 hypothetical protein [Paraburkholderia fungorum]PRZ54638.1 hypothetical protein BX589_106173 [Paraburkholderia fungorum]
MFDLSQEMADSVFGLSNIVLTIGAALVLLGTAGAFWSGGIRDRYSDERITSNEAKTAQAVAQAAQANQRAEEEKLARVKIEERLAPRSLTGAQETNLQNQLSKFAGTSLDILIYGGGSEDALPFAGMIATTLNAAGWKVRVWNTISPGRWYRGVGLSTSSGSDQSAENAANELVGSLAREGIGVGRLDQFVTGELPDNVNGPPWDANNVAPIRMVIGSKP